MDKLNAAMNKYTKKETPVKRLTRSATKDSPKVEEDKIAKDHLDLVIKERKNKFEAPELKTTTKQANTTVKKPSVSESRSKTPFHTGKKEFLNNTQFRIKNTLTFKKDNYTNIKKPAGSASVRKEAPGTKKKTPEKA
jgi:hypothetical protein